MNRLRERWSQLDQRTLDRLIAVGMTALMVVSVVGSTNREGSIALNLVLGIPVTAVLVVRRSHPLAALTASAGFDALLTAFATASFEFPPATIALIIGSFSVGMHEESDARARFGLALVLVSIVVTAAFETPDDIIFPAFLFGFAPWGIGRVLRGHTLLARELADKETKLRHIRGQERRSAIFEERSRVARELHDVLAHNLSVMVIQASGARRALGSDADAAIAAAELIETSGREALVELRHVFGPVRHGEGESLEGSPGLAQVDNLLERARGGGLPVTLAVAGDPVELPPGADMAAYRLIQEALTNTIKHAGAPRTEVSIGYRPDGVAIEVRDEGASGAPAFAEGGGHGLIGMRERFAVYGGEVEAGPRDGGGFRVRGRLPVVRERVIA